MQNLSKRQWGNQLSVKSAAEILIDWCIKAYNKNVLRKKPPQIYSCYVVKDTPPLQFMNNVSNVFKYSQKDVPYIDQARDSLLRCLSVALKAHFFLFPQDEVCHEPYFFALPNLQNPSLTTFGIIYKLTKDDKSIIVCERDIAQMFNHIIPGLPSNPHENDLNIVFEFPVVVTSDRFSWYNLKSWKAIKDNAGMDDRTPAPWLDKGYLTKAKMSANKEELSRYATILEVPYAIKDAIKPLGIEWCKGAQTWFLPRGFDVDAVNVYIEYVKSEYKEPVSNGNGYKK